jgi:hypothetical protein
MKPALAVLVLLLFVKSSNAQTLLQTKGLTKIHIVIENVGTVGREMGLNAEILESQTLVALRRDIPTLKIDSDSNSGTLPYLYVNVLATHAGATYAAYVSMALSRPVVVFDDTGSAVQGRSMARVWNTGMLLSGDNDIVSKIRGTINDDIVEFAAKYYKENTN